MKYKNSFRNFGFDKYHFSFFPSFSYCNIINFIPITHLHKLLHGKYFVGKVKKTIPLRKIFLESWLRAGKLSFKPSNFKNIELLNFESWFLVCNIYTTIFKIFLSGEEKHLHHFQFRFQISVFRFDLIKFLKSLRTVLPKYLLHKYLNIIMFTFCIQRKWQYLFDNYFYHTNAS